MTTDNQRDTSQLKKEKGEKRAHASQHHLYYL